MAVTNKTEFKGKSNLGWKLDIEEEDNTAYNSDTVSIRSLIDGKVTITGTVSGNVYVWGKVGDTQDVDIRDKDEILNKKRGRTCCGGNSGKPLFEIV